MNVELKPRRDLFPVPAPAPANDNAERRRESEPRRRGDLQAGEICHDLQVVPARNVGCSNSSLSQRHLSSR